MPSMPSRRNIRKIKMNPDEEDIERYGSLLFSPIYYEKIIKQAINYFHVKEFKKICCYSSPNGDHYLFTVIFPRTKIIDEGTIKAFTKEMKARLVNSGFYGDKHWGKNRITKELFGKNRKASELPLVWKSKTVGGCWCINFERYANEF